MKYSKSKMKNIKKTFLRSLILLLLSISFSKCENILESLHKIGEGRCADDINELYDYIYFKDIPNYEVCSEMCEADLKITYLVGLEYGSSNKVCYCLYTNSRPNPSFGSDINGIFPNNSNNGISGSHLYGMRLDGYFFGFRGEGIPSQIVSNSIYHCFAYDPNKEVKFEVEDKMEDIAYPLQTITLNPEIEEIDLALESIEERFNAIESHNSKGTRRFRNRLSLSIILSILLLV